MNDTSADIEKLQFEMMMGLGAKRRIELACEMYMAARASVLASIPPKFSESERRTTIVERMYGRDFSEAFFKDDIT